MLAVRTTCTFPRVPADGLHTAFPGCYTKVEKREIQILVIKKELELTGRSSAMFPWTPAVVHIHKKYLTHTKYTFDQNRSCPPRTKNISTRVGKKKNFTSRQHFVFFYVYCPFCLFVCFLLWIFGGRRAVMVQSQWVSYSPFTKSVSITVGSGLM